MLVQRMGAGQSYMKIDELNKIVDYERELIEKQKKEMEEILARKAEVEKQARERRRQLAF